MKVKVRGSTKPRKVNLLKQFVQHGTPDNLVVGAFEGSHDVNPRNIGEQDQLRMEDVFDFVKPSPLRDKIKELHEYLLASPLQGQLPGLPSFMCIIDAQPRLTKHMQTFAVQVKQAYYALSQEQSDRASKLQVFVPNLLQDRCWCLSPSGAACLKSELAFSQHARDIFQMCCLVYPLFAKQLKEKASITALEELFCIGKLSVLGAHSAAMMSATDSARFLIYPQLSTRRILFRLALMTAGCVTCGAMQTPVCIESATRPSNIHGKAEGVQARAHCSAHWSARGDGVSRTELQNWPDYCRHHGVIVSANDVQGYGPVKALYTETAAPKGVCTVCEKDLEGFAQLVAHITTEKHIARVCTCSLTERSCRCDTVSPRVVYDCFKIAAPDHDVTGGQRTHLPVEPPHCLGAWDVPITATGSLTVSVAWSEYFSYLRKTSNHRFCDCPVTVHTKNHMRDVHPAEFARISNGSRLAQLAYVETGWQRVVILGQEHVFERTVRSSKCKKGLDFSRRNGTGFFTCPACTVILILLNGKSQESTLALQRMTFEQVCKVPQPTPLQEQINILSNLLQFGHTRDFIRGLVFAIQRAGDLMVGVSQTFLRNNEVQNELQVKIISAVFSQINNPTQKHQEILSQVADAHCNLGGQEYQRLAKTFLLPSKSTSKQNGHEKLRPMAYLGGPTYETMCASHKSKFQGVLSYDHARVARQLDVIFDGLQRYIVGLKAPTDPLLSEWHKDQHEISKILARERKHHCSSSLNVGDDAGYLHQWATRMVKDGQLDFSVLVTVVNPLQSHATGTPVGLAAVDMPAYYVCVTWILHWYKLSWLGEPKKGSNGLPTFTNCTKWIDDQYFNLFAVVGDSLASQFKAHKFLLSIQEQFILKGFRYAFLDTGLQILFPLVGKNWFDIISALPDYEHWAMSVCTRQLWSGNARYCIWRKDKDTEVVAVGEHINRVCEKNGYGFEDIDRSTVKTNSCMDKKPDAPWSIATEPVIQALDDDGHVGTAGFLELLRMVLDPLRSNFMGGVRQGLTSMMTSLIAHRTIRAYQIKAGLLVSSNNKRTGAPRAGLTACGCNWKCWCGASCVRTFP